LPSGRERGIRTVRGGTPLTSVADSGLPVDLTNCESEPIHLPGSIQPHGTLYVCERDGTIAGASANAVPAGAVGQPLAELFPELSGPPEKWTMRPIAIERGGRHFDVTTSESDGSLLVEIEPASPTDLVAVDRQIRHLGALQRSRGVLPTLEMGAHSVRELGGYDRVMVYRFRPDLSGEVVVDDHAGELPSWLGQRYPATDIPAQARRLYALNVTRMIVDVNGGASPLQPAACRNVDLGPAALRSVSPIHLEYLRNMGVQASFSVSILIAGQLWGLIAAHHRQPLYLSRSQRAYCELLAQHIALVVDAEGRRELADGLARAAERHTRIIDRANSDDDLIQGLAGVGEDLQILVPSSAMALVLGQRIVTTGNAPARDEITRLAALLESRNDREIRSNAVQTDLPGLSLQPAGGVLGINFNPSANGWVFWFRPEMEQTITWGGDPRKNVTSGPLGTRLTPRGSFDAYIETVRGTAEEWSAADLAVSERLRESLAEVALRKSVQLARLRELVIGTVSHDLRSPLTAIRMAASLMDAGTSEPELTASIAASSRRMQRLLDNLMELSRLHSSGITLQREEVSLAEVASRIAAEASMAFESDVRVEASGDTTARVDIVRIEQLLANLLSNARHHGDPTAPVTVHVDGTADSVTIRVHNFGPEIAPAVRDKLFEAFASSRAGTSGGLGLGLYIASRVVAAHGGTITVDSSTGDGTTFRVDIPRNA
jgi:two-component system, chemotaxis family, sensor kinase Cph1